MISNYLKLAIKVLGRRTFFTAISLFGISFTLMVLILLSAFIDAEFGNHQPLTQKDDMVFLERAMMKLIVQDTTWEVDSLRLDGNMVYDSTMQVKDITTSTSTASTGYYLCNNYLRDVTGAVNYSFYAPSRTFDLFIEGKKLTFNAIYADAAYWQIFDFSFSHGRPFTKQENDNASQIAILSTQAARNYFGSSSNAVGKFLELDGKQFEVIGIIKKLKNAKPFVSADVYLPLQTINPMAINQDDLLGTFEAVFLANSEKSKADILASLEQKAKQIPLPNPEEYNNLYLKGTDLLGRYALYVLPISDNNYDKAKKVFLLITISLLLLFVLLPTLNLINLNVSRVMERSAEIGVRKAFGAHSGSILMQLVFENVILTLLGGIIGYLLAYIVLYLVNDSNILGEIVLQFNTTIFIYSILICLAFGIISGLLPAYRMSKIHIVNAIKQHQI